MTKFDKICSDLIDVQNIIWSEVSKIHKESWDESDGSKRQVLDRVSVVSDSVDLTRLLLEQVDSFLSDRITGAEFIESLKSEPISELISKVSSLQEK